MRHEIGAKPLSDNPVELKEIIIERDETILSQQQRIDHLEEFIRLQKHRQFAARSEKASGQGELFDEAEDLIDVEETEPEIQTDASSAQLTKASTVKSGRKPLPADPPRVRIEYDLPESERYCPCGCQRTLIGEETSEQLDILPASVRVLVHVRKKYVCKACEEGINIAPLPPQPIPKSMASPGLLAYIATAKYQDGLPLYRLEAIFKRMHIDLGRNTQARWMIKSSNLLQPLYNLLEERLLSSPYIHGDKTVVQVLKEPDKTPQSRSYMWVRASDLADQKVILFDYALGRGGDIAKQLFGDYKGYLQTDDYAGYNAVCAGEHITQLGYWAHTRRKFIDAQKATALKGKKVKTGKASVAINLIGKLYNIERQIKDQTVEARYAIRQRDSVPILNKLRHWLDKTLHSVLPKGLLGKALNYLHRN